MAFINFYGFLVYLSEMSNIDIDILRKNQNYLLKALSPLLENEFKAQECVNAIQSIDEIFFIKIGLKDEEKIKKIYGDIFIILKTKWQEFR